MASSRPEPQHLSRRALLRGLGLTPFLVRESSLFGFPLLTSPAGTEPEPAFPFADVRFVPHYPLRSPLEDVLRLVSPGSDEYLTEGYAFEIGLLLQSLSRSFQSGTLSDVKNSLSPTLFASSLVPTKQTPLRDGGRISAFRQEFPGAIASEPDRVLSSLHAWIGHDTQVETADFEITGIEELGSNPLLVRTDVRYSLVGVLPSRDREQRVGSWVLEWAREGTPNGAGRWRVRRWEAKTETRAVAHGPGFVDVTQAALGRNASYGAQMLHGADEWRTVLDSACGIDVYGNNGVAAGDFDNDGFDDLYVCQPAGLPNRLYRNRGDGTFDDVTEKAGVGVLDNTACALFADFRNSGLQDLLVVCGNGPLLFLNHGDGTFQLKRDAFRFQTPAQGTFTHAAIADYDGDGRLDIYFCVYSYYLGLNQYHYPAPYFDARNGPPNFLFHNEGDATFVDRTEAAGLNADNDRYSFACAWGQSASGSLPELYVVNDFGRNNFYRRNADGTFHSVSTEAQVEDVGAGMSACWADYNDDARSDLYVANMWSAAGQRVSQQALFHARTPEKTRELYKRHARGNALYRNRGDGTFQNVSEQAGVEVGRWAWGSDFWDFDQDGFPDLYVTNGYISAPESSHAATARPSMKEASAHQSDSLQDDLGSFFWRQVVAKSPDDATPSLAYEHGWNALNELIRSDRSWSGHERNVMLVNNRDGTFSEISGAVGMDFLEDGRSFALADLDGDGRLEVILKNRNAPQLRILRNAMADLGDSIAIRLRGTKSSRDAIGAVVTLVAGELRQTKFLQAGSGFLAQHSKTLFFGLGKSEAAVQANVRWPNGLVQQFAALPRNSRIDLEEGAADLKATPFGATSPAFTRAAAIPAPSAQKPSRPSTDDLVETWLIDPLKAPAFALPDLSSTERKLDSTRGRPTLLHFWATTSPIHRDQLQRLQRLQASAAADSLQVLAVNLDPAESVNRAREIAAQQRLSYPVLFATKEIAGIYNITYRYLFDRRRDLAIPTSFLLDREGMIVKVYQGAVSSAGLLADVRSMPRTPAERVRKALPFYGKMYQAEFLRNDFTYGAAMFQHGYLEQAAESFQQVVAAKPNNAEGYYNLGTLNLRRNNFPQARQYLEQTLKLKPDYPEAWNNLGMMAAQEGHADQAIQSFKQSLLLRPTYATALLNLGNVYRRQRAFAEAQDCLTRALDLQPDEPEANYSLGMLYAQQNQLAPASQYLGKAIEVRPDYAEALNNLGVLYVREQEYAKAEQQFRTCIRLNPSFEDSYINLARLYVVQHEKGKAKDALGELLRLRPESAVAKQGLQALDAMP